MLFIGVSVFFPRFFLRNNKQMTFELTIMSGAGNIFSVLDNRRYHLSVEQARQLAPELCSNIPVVIEQTTHCRSTEGLLIIDEPQQQNNTDFLMLFVNPDGSTGAMCGNGGRCAVHFAVQRHFTTKTSEIRFTAFETLYKADYTQHDTIRLYFPPPRAVTYPHQLHLDGKTVTVGITDLGSDHVVVFADELCEQIQGFNGKLQDLNLEYWGKKFRFHPDFPRGANANFYSIMNDKSHPPVLHLRTFERGVEAETGACGTGALSTALIASLRHTLQPPIHIITSSGQSLLLDFQPGIHTIHSMVLEGGAEILNIYHKNIPS